MRLEPFLRKQYYLKALLFSIFLVALVFALTNRYDPEVFDLVDEYHYICMAQNFFEGDCWWSPFAYRYVTPLLAGTIYKTTSLSLHDCFLLLSIIGCIFQLYMIMVIAKYFTENKIIPFIIAAFFAFSFGCVKYNVFYPYNNDILSLGLFLLAMYFVLQQKWWWVVIIASLGLQVREFMGVPGAVAFVMCCSEYIKTRKTSLLCTAVTMFVFLTLAVVLPRYFITVHGSAQIVDPVLRPESSWNLLNYLLNWKRLIHIVLAIICLFLPLILLLDKKSYSRLKAYFLNNKLMLLSFVSIVLFLTVYGGTDIYRFVVYLSFILIIGLVFVLEENWVHPLTIILTVIIVFIFNRIYAHIPLNMEGYVKIVFKNNIPSAIELISYIVLMFLLRNFLHYREKRKISGNIN